jgi:hypothetical protein
LNDAEVRTKTARPTAIRPSAASSGVSLGTLEKSDAVQGHLVGQPGFHREVDQAASFFLPACHILVKYRSSGYWQHHGYIDQLHG